MKTKPPKTQETFEQAREQFHRSVLSSVSHDLKTPLACIIGSLEIYDKTKEKLTPEKKDALLNTALHEAYRLDRFVTNILDMAQFESNAVRVKKELCVMDLLIEDCLTFFAHRLHECTISVKALPATFPVTTDPILLMRAICIILDNAVQYGPANPVIAIEYEKTEDQVHIRIQDNGEGIPEAHKEIIFSKYTRFAQQDYKRAGTGLGLSICREIMRLLGGTVTAANLEGGKGAVFTLSFSA